MFINNVHSIPKTKCFLRKLRIFSPPIKYFRNSLPPTRLHLKIKKYVVWTYLCTPIHNLAEVWKWKWIAPLYLRFHITVLKIQVFWDMTLCEIVHNYWCFREACWSFHLHDLSHAWLSLTHKRAIFTVCCLKIDSYSSKTLSLVKKLPYYVLQTYYIMFANLYYWKYLGDWGMQIVSSRAACWLALV